MHAFIPIWKSPLNTFLLSLLLLSETFGLWAQVPATVVRQKGDVVELGELTTVTLNFDSRLLKRNVSYRALIPHGYTDPKNKNRRYPVLYLLHGLGGHYDNWTDKTRIAYYARNYGFIIITPEGGDGWYTDSS